MQKSLIIGHLLKTQMKKLILAGPTGAGKTTIFVSIFPHKEKNLNEVKRRIHKESATEQAFTPIDEESFKDSTTTVSFNVTSIVACINRANRMTLHDMSSNLNFLVEEEFDYILPLQIVDIAGQDRFSFMVDTMIKGASGVIFVSDGSNVSSINRLPDYIEYLHQEEMRTDKKIPSVAFVHKSDLKEKYLYVGTDHARSALPPEVPVYETTAKEPDTIILPLRQLIVAMFQKPLTSEILNQYLFKLKTT